MATLSLTRNELEELDAFLISGATSSSVMALDTLHGFLTAIALAPVGVPVGRWLAYLWNNSAAPVAHRLMSAKTRRMVSLILRIHDDIVAALHAPENDFSPLVMTRVSHGRRYADGEMWCYGFLQGMTVNPHDWVGLRATPAGRSVLGPILLLGSDKLSAAEESLAATPRKRAELTAGIPTTVDAIRLHFLHARLVRAKLQEQDRWPVEDLPPRLH